MTENITENNEIKFVEYLKNNIPDDVTLIALSESFKVFGDSTRIKIIFALQKAELCVNHLAQVMDMGQSAISHQLRILRSAKIVKTRREGKNIYYSLDDDHVAGIIALGLEHIMEKDNHLRTLDD